MNFNLPTYAIVLLIILALVELGLKGVALWKSSQNKEKYWFVALLILNTAGILPLIYIFSRKNSQA